jgi:hypothetical protein
MGPLAMINDNSGRVMGLGTALLFGIILMMNALAYAG